MLQILVFILFPTFVQSNEFPEVQIKIIDNRRTVFVAKNSFTFPHHFDQIILECVSFYPNKWSFSNPLNEGDLTRHDVEKTRKVSDFHDVSTYQFISNLNLTFKNPKTDLNLSCSHINRKIEKELRLTTLVDLSTAPDSSGVTVNIQEGILRAGGNPRLGQNKDCSLTIHFDKDSHKYGCSTTELDEQNNSKIVQARHVACNDNDECSVIIKLDNCTNSFVDTCKFDSCQEMVKPGAIICELGGNQVARAIFMTAEDPPTYYIRNVTDITVSQVLKLKILNGSIFQDETIWLSCSAATSYFSKGIKWGFLYDGNRIELFEPEQSFESNEGYTYTMQSSILLPSTLIKGVVCLAPVRNSVRWENVSIGLNIRVVPRPRIIGSDNIDTRTVKENGTVTMECHLEEQDVLPVQFSWFRNGKMLRVNPKSGFVNSNGSDIHNTNVSTKITIFHVAQDSNYSCVAINKREQREEKHFIVFVTSVTFPVLQTFYTTYRTLIIVSSIIVITLIVLIVILSRINRMQSLKIQNLSEYDIEEFLKGDPQSDNALFYPYDVRYELCRKDFHIESKVLGSGQFGIVLKGRVGKAPVAIKTVKKGAEVGYVKALLSELKILSFVGRHDNIVSLIGACTENISKCEVYIICEFCSNGNILEYLRKSREIFINTDKHKRYGSFRESVVEYQNASVKKPSSKDLLKWAYEIACGMEFLSSKKVIHGDLAARNVLLTDDLTAKVGDFGLSKQLFQYSVYVQRQECPLPLKWMAIESLQDLEFSTQSDVWSYAILLWEIFTLGQSPYPGINWDCNSWKLLAVDGYRMDKPQYASENTYKAMLQCWELEPNKRPDFTSLKEFFLQQCSLLANSKNKSNP